MSIELAQFRLGNKRVEAGLGAWSVGDTGSYAPDGTPCSLALVHRFGVGHGVAHSPYLSNELAYYCATN